jgi:hypothetical protein
MASIPCLDPIAFSCPACGQRFSAPAEFVGMVATCRGCKGEITVPAQSADPNATVLREPAGAATPPPRLPPGRPSGVNPWPTRPPV